MQSVNDNGWHKKDQKGNPTRYCKHIVEINNTTQKTWYKTNYIAT